MGKHSIALASPQVVTNRGRGSPPWCIMACAIFWRCKVICSTKQLDLQMKPTWRTPSIISQHMHETAYGVLLLRGRTGTHSDCGQHEPSNNSGEAAPDTPLCSPDARGLHGLPQPCPPAVCTFNYAGKQSEQGVNLVSTILTYCMWQVEKGPYASKQHSRNSKSLSSLSFLPPSEKKRQKKNTHFVVNSMRSQVLYRAAPFCHPVAMEFIAT